MIQYQRHKEILAKLEGHQAISIRRLAKELYTSESTIRRDLSDLEQQGLVRRVYGGVVPVRQTGVDMPAFHREQENAPQKQEIAARAAELIEDGLSLFLDASTTVSHLLPYLTHHKNLTVVTNSLMLTQKLGEAGNGIRVFCTGGLYLQSNQAFGGAAAIRTVEQLRADLMFFSSRGLSLDGEITDSSEYESELRRAMLARAATRVFLCDDSKLGRQFLFKLCDRSGYDRIICNAPLPPSLADAVPS